MRNRVLPEQWAYTDALLAADWPTCDYWNCNLSLAFRWSALLWPNTAPVCIWPDHWEQIWMNFNWKSGKMLSAGHRVIYDITLIPGVSAKNGRNGSTEQKCKQWMRNIKCTFRFLGYLMKRSGFWDVSHYGSEWMISSNMTKTLHFSNKGVLSFEDQYFYPFIEP